MPLVKQVRNWKEYNQSLSQRGEIILCMTEEFFDKLYYGGQQKKGGVRKYNKEMFEAILGIQVALNFPIRASIGFMRGLLKRVFHIKEPEIVNFGHASRVFKTLDMKVKQYTKAKSNIVLSFDSTGVSIHSISGWHQRKHGGQKKLNAKERWRKIHIAMDLESGQILGCKMTSSTTNDCEVVKPMVETIKKTHQIKKIVGDGAYDTYAIYKIGHELDATVIVPPAITSKAQNERKKKPKILLKHLKQRDEAIHFIRTFDDFEDGRKAWKKASGYHERSKIEALMFRLKRTFGFSLRYKNEHARSNEIISKINILNKMLALGRAEYVT